MYVQRETCGAKMKAFGTLWCRTILTRVVGVVQAVWHPVVCVAEGEFHYGGDC